MLSFGQVGLIEKNKSGMGILIYSSSIPAPFPLPISVKVTAQTEELAVTCDKLMLNCRYAYSAKG